MKIKNIKINKKLLICIILTLFTSIIFWYIASVLNIFIFLQKLNFTFFEPFNYFFAPFSLILALICCASISFFLWWKCFYKNNFSNDLQENKFLSKKEFTKNFAECCSYHKTDKYGFVTKLSIINKLPVVNTINKTHALVIGATGSGKTQNIIIPTIILNAYSIYKPSMIISDPKGELFEKQSLILEKQGYNIKVLDLKNFEIGNQWNPLNYIFKLWKQKSYIKVNKEIDSLVNIICPIHYNTNPHWDQTAQNFIKGIIYALLEDYDMNKNINENNFNFSSINKILFLPLEELKSYIFDRNIESKAKKYFANLNTTSQENKEVDSLMSTTKTVLNKFENLEIILSNNNFDFQEFIDKPTALFLILSDHSNEYHFLANLFIAQLYKFLVGKADNSDLKTLKRPTLFLLDEFANLPTIKDIDNWITAARSRNIWFMLVIQDFEQLKNKYKNYRTLIANCNLKYFLHTNDYQNAKILAEEYGTIKVNESSTTKSEKHISTTTYQKQKPLITAETLIKLPVNTQIIKYNRLNVAKFETLPIWKIKNYTEGKTVLINEIENKNIITISINNEIRTIKDKINWLLKQDLSHEIKNIIKQIKNEKELQNYILKIKENLSLELVLKIKENNII